MRQSLAPHGALATAAARPSPTPALLMEQPRTVFGKVALTSESDPNFDLSKCSGTLARVGTATSRAFAVQSDGAFRVPDVPPGRYTVTIRAHLGADPVTTATATATSKAVRATLDEPSRKIGLASLDFTIRPGAPSAMPALNIGVVRLEVPKSLTGTAAAPDFVVATMDGEEIALKSLRGKYVLLEFWASWCGFCRTETPFAQEIYRDYGANPRFVMLGLSVDKQIEQAEKYVAQNDLKWPQGVLGSWAHDKVSQAYGVDDVPTFVLIGPQGNVLAKSASAKAIRDSVAKALEPKGD